MRWLILALALTLAACGRVVPMDDGTPGGAFPHAAGYPDHGVQALADPVLCASCHDTGNSVAGAGPACGACHDYPHERTMHLGAVHGAAWLADRTACTDCHGADGGRAPAEVVGATCSGCHNVFPHPDGFLGVHGAAVTARGGPQACATCHPADAPSGPGTCAACHAPYPHPDGFAAPEAHGAAASATCTEGCHAPDGTEGPRCTQCHDLYPHADGWSRTHLLPVQSRGEGACRDCHGEGTPQGPTLPVSCGATCHQGAP